MGGRGATSNIGGKTNGGSEKSNEALLSINTKFTSKELNSMSRSQLEIVARAIYIKQNPRLSVGEADLRARSLMSGNTDKQLKSYIKKYG